MTINLQVHGADAAKKTANFLALAVVFFYWFWVWQTPILTADDYMFAARSGLPHGGVRLEDLLRDGSMYFWQINGRLSDVITQYILSSPILIAVVPALFHVAFTAGVYVWIDLLLAPRFRGWMRWASSMGTAFILPFGLILLEESLAGDMYYFLAGTISTLGGAVCALWTMYFTIHAATRPNGWKYLLVAVLVFLLLGLMHELTSFFLIPSCLIFLIVGFRWSDLRVSALPVLTVITLSVLRLMAPGIWRRTAVVQDNLVPDADSYLSPTARAIRAITHLAAFPVPIVLLLAVSVLLYALVYFNQGSISRVGNVVALLGIAASALWWIGGNKLNERRIATAWDAYDLQNALFFSKTAGLTVFAAFIAVVSTLAALYLVVSRQKNLSGGVLGAALVGAFSTILIPVVLGNWMGRQFFYFDVFALIIIAICLLNSMDESSESLRSVSDPTPPNTVRTAMRVVAAAAAIVIAVASIGFAVIHVTHISRTHSEYTAFLALLDEAREGKRTSVSVPPEFTYTYIVSGALHFRQDTPEAFRLYYSLPETTELDVQ